MVTINLTMLIELILFLVFLWGTQRFILAPVLQSMDERNDSIECEIEKAQVNDQRSEELEHKYRHEIAVIRRDADDELRAFKQKASSEHADFLKQERLNAEKAVAEVRAEFQTHVASQRDAVLAQVSELSKLMEAKLTADSQQTNRGGAE